MLKGRAALVTGSTRGLGKAIAEALAGEGCHVMLNGFGDRAEIDALAAALSGSHGVDVAYSNADLARVDQVEALARAASDRFGRLDVLVNNAVIRYFADIPDFSVEDWDHALAVNLSAPFHLVRLLLPGMRRNGWGRIVNISSVLGLSGRAGRVDYVTTKTALIGLTRAIAAETREDENITCNAICPASVMTTNTEIKIAELAEREGLDLEAARREYLRRRRQPGGFIEPARIAKLIVHLAKDDSRDINGAAIPVDTGRSAAWSGEG